MLNEFCFCINLKSGVLFLAALGVFINLIGVISAVNARFGFYFIFRSVPCVLGFIGVFRDNFIFVTIFIYYYFIAVATELLVTILFSVIMFLFRPTDFCVRNHPIDYESCIRVFISLRILLVVVMAFADIIQVYFSLVIWSYYKKFREEEHGEYRLVSNDEV